MGPKFTMPFDTNEFAFSYSCKMVKFEQNPNKLQITMLMYYQSTTKFLLTPMFEQLKRFESRGSY